MQIYLRATSCREEKEMCVIALRVNYSGLEGDDADKGTRQETAGSTVQSSGGWVREEATECRKRERDRGHGQGKD